MSEWGQQVLRPLHPEESRLEAQWPLGAGSECRLVAGKQPCVPDASEGHSVPHTKRLVRAQLSASTLGCSLCKQVTGILSVTNSSKAFLAPAWWEDLAKRQVELPREQAVYRESSEEPLPLSRLQRCTAFLLVAPTPPTGVTQKPERDPMPSCAVSLPIRHVPGLLDMVPNSFAHTIRPGQAAAA
ncbi:hypothetical protein H8959_013866 [Pygathrix nigripes]